MATSYNPYYSGGWQSGEEGGTPITPDALNHMDDGIAGSYDYTQQSMAVSNLTNNITPVSTYVDTLSEQRLYRQHNIVMFSFTFKAKAQSVSADPIFTGLPGAVGIVQFTAVNVTTQKPVTMAVGGSGNVFYYYSNTGFSAGDNIRGSVTYICAQ